MGRRGGQRGGRGGGKHGGGQRPRYDNREEITRANGRFEEYYNELGLVEEAESGDFWASLRRDLPSSFRFAGSKSQALPVQQLLKDRYIPDITSIEYNGEIVTPPTPLPWFPDQLAWQMTTPKNVVRKFAPFAAFQRFLVSETGVGNISRQEAVSMIPPLLLDLKPGMTALDLCAAPGSKAAQLIEMVHGSEEARMRKVARKAWQSEGRDISPEGPALKEEMDEEEVEQTGDWSDDGRATGLLIANDSDYKRAHMLTHQMKRLNSPNLIVTNHDATMYPSIKLPSDTVSNKYLKFDRILADVPCSGDGTARKNFNIWKDWTPGNAMGLYSTQHRILVRGLQMLKAGGRLVYSTCSMNPVENEAVIATAIDRCGGTSKVDIIDCSNDLPKLKRKSGLIDWKVMDKGGKTWESWKEVEQHKAVHGEESVGKLVESMFSPKNQEIPLQRCMRVYPHLQDTGGFFIAVLEKKTEIKARPEAEPKQSEAEHSSIVGAVNSIEQQSTPNGAGANPIEKIDALDAIVPSSINGESEDPSAAARQNKINAPTFSTTPAKRSLDEAADAEMSTKRPKFREQAADPAPQGAEDRQVHWPPPPGATLDASRPETTTAMEPPALIPKEMDSNAEQKGILPQAEALPLRKRNQPYEEPFKYLDPSHPDLEDIFTFYDISSRFPRDRFMVRNAMGTPSKTIYYTSSLARDILSTNANSGIKFAHCGVKMFVKQDVQGAGVCRWRIQSEGLPLLEAWVGEKRSVRLYKRSTLRTLLVEMFAKIEGENWNTTLDEIGDRVRDIGMGCCILRVEKSQANIKVKAEEGEEGFSERMVLPLWRSLYSLNLMLPKEDRKAMLLRLYNEDTPLQDHSKDRFQKKSDVVKTEHGMKKEVKQEEVVIKAEGNEEDLAAAGLGEQVDAMDSADDDDAGGVPLKEDDIVPEALKQG